MIFRDEMISRKEMVAHSVDVVILDSTCYRTEGAICSMSTIMIFFKNKNLLLSRRLAEFKHIAKRRK